MLTEDIFKVRIRPIFNFNKIVNKWGSIENKYSNIIAKCKEKILLLQVKVGMYELTAMLRLK